MFAQPRRPRALSLVTRVEADSAHCVGWRFECRLTCMFCSAFSHFVIMTNGEPNGVAHAQHVWRVWLTVIMRKNVEMGDLAESTGKNKLMIGDHTNTEATCSWSRFFFHLCAQIHLWFFFYPPSFSSYKWQSAFGKRVITVQVWPWICSHVRLLCAPSRCKKWRMEGEKGMEGK